MAPLNRTPLQNASKKIKTIISSPAHFIRKRLRRSGSTPDQIVKTLAVVGALNCTHKAVGIAKYTDKVEARQICDGFIENATSYSTSTENFLTELGETFKSMVDVWTNSLEIMKCGTGMKREDHQSLREFHSRAVNAITEVANDVERNVWKSPTSNLSCRYHKDLDEIFFQVCRCHEDIRRLLSLVGMFIENCKMPTQHYGVKCRLELRMKLREADSEVLEITATLKDLLKNYGCQLEDIFLALKKSASSIAEFLSNVRETPKRFDVKLSSVLID